AAEQAMFAAAEDHNPDRKRCHKRSRGTLPYAETCVYGDASAPPVAAVWADSVGAELGMIYGQTLGRQGMSARSITASGCPAQTSDANTNCAAHNAQILVGLTGEANIRTVVLIANYRGYEEEPQSEMPDSLLDA